VRITRIELKNVRNFGHKKITVGPEGVLLAGRNGAGKSTILESVRLALFNRCAYTSQAGRGYGSMISQGRDTAEILVDLDYDLRVCLRLTQKKRDWCVINYDGVVLYDTPELLWQRLGVDPRDAELAGAISACVESGALETRLEEYFAGDLSVEAVLAHCGEHADWFRAWLLQYPAPVTPADWRGIGDTAYTVRSVVNREVKQVKADLESLGCVTPPQDRKGRVLTVADLPKVQAMAEKLCIKRDALQRELGAAATIPVYAPVDRAQAETERDTAQQALTDAQTRLHTLQEQQSGLRGQVRDLMTRLSHARSTVAEMTHQLERWQESATGLCPTCGQPLPRDRQAEIVKHIEAGTEQKAGAEKALAETQNAVDHATGRLDGYEAEIAQAQEAVGAASAQLREVEARLNAPAPPPQPRPVAEIEVDITDVTDALARTENAAAALRTLEQYDGLKHRLAAVEATARRLTWVVEAFRNGAGAVLSKLAGADRRSELEARCNAELEPFGYQMEIRTDPKLHVLMGAGPGGDLLPLTARSRGEQWLAQYALALAYSHGTVPVLLDDLNDLDGEHAQAVYRRLAQEQQLIMATACADAAITEHSAIPVEWIN